MWIVKWLPKLFRFHRKTSNRKSSNLKKLKMEKNYESIVGFFFTKAVTGT